MDFEAQREANIAANLALLAQLDLTENNIIIPRKKPQPVKSKKRKPSSVEETEGDDEEAKPAKKAQAVMAPNEDASGGPRRSGRLTGKKMDYSGDGDALKKNDGPIILTEKARQAAEKEPMGVANRTQNPYVASYSSPACSTMKGHADLCCIGKHLVPSPVWKLGRGGRLGKPGQFETKLVG